MIFFKAYFLEKKNKKLFYINRIEVSVRLAIKGSFKIALKSLLIAVKTQLLKIKYIGKTFVRKNIKYNQRNEVILFLNINGFKEIARN